MYAMANGRVAFGAAPLCMIPALANVGPSAGLDLDTHSGALQSAPLNVVAAAATLGSGALRRRRRQRAAARQAAAASTTGLLTHAPVAQEEPWEEGPLEGQLSDAPCAPVDESTFLDEGACAELTRQLEESGQSRDAALCALRGFVLAYSLQAGACRVVQTALQVADRAWGSALAEELHGHVRTLVGSQHGNYVIQKLVEVMPLSQADFVGQELLGIGADMACHRYGCRVLCRLFEHHASEMAGHTAVLLAEVLGASGELCRHAYGHHVVECAIEHGSTEQQHQIANALQRNVLRNAKNRHASYVIRKSLSLCSEEDQQAIARSILERPENILLLAENNYGCFVARALLKIPTEYSQAALTWLHSAPPPAHISKKAKRVRQELQLACAEC